MPTMPLVATKITNKYYYIFSKITNIALSPRNATQIAVLPRQVIRPSVRLSVRDVDVS